MKKFIAGVIALSLVCGMSACVSGDSSSSSENTTATTTTTTTSEETTTTTTTAETTTTTEETTTTTEKPTTTTTTTTTKATTTTTTTTAEEPKDQVLFDNNGIKITFTGMDYTSSIFGPEIKVLIENSTSTNYTVQVRDFSANGFMVDTTMSADVNAGKKANDSIGINSWSLEENSISEDDMQTFEFSFHIFNSDDWSDGFDTETIIIQL